MTTIPVSRGETVAAAIGRSAPVTADVVMVGAGSVGLSLGMALAQAGVTVVLVGNVDLRPTGRTVALLEGSIGFLARLGLWSQLTVDAEPLKVMRIVDDTGSLFRGPPVAFEAGEIGRTQFGANIENHRLVAALADAAAVTPGLTLLPGRLEHFTFGSTGVSARGADDVAVAGDVLIASDGRRSAARQAAGLSAQEWHYPQTALTTTLHHDRPHLATCRPSSIPVRGRSRWFPCRRASGGAEPFQPRLGDGDPRRRSVGSSWRRSGWPATSSGKAG